ncbi:MAG: 1,4-dihydroxy-6-naphthoate synthase [Chitinophagaceae bacterium]|jgi:1,4-dihydroxy-6-naphthoate synthase|nr:1,4-dihydroxy-6-naphthoate synthase [Chitinophagaceae bacterium]
MKLSLGISPCPNDTYIFDAMLHGKIDTEGLEITPRLEDVETLNHLAIEGSLDITKVSYGVVFQLINRYMILEAGSALGKGVGPLFVSKNIEDEKEIDPSKISVALPGINTTAHLLFSLAYPEIKNKTFVPFHVIEDMVLTGAVDAGVIIHENRFTYQQKGLKKISDLGDVWEKRTGAPIPLGGILVRRSFDLELSTKINRVINRSLAYANENAHALPSFVTENAQEMSEEVMRNHIGLYVNEFSLALGKEGRLAVLELIRASAALNQKGFPEGLNIFLQDN